MKKYIVLSILLLISLTINAQVIIIQTSLVAHSSYNTSLTKWDDWSEWLDCSVTIRVDTPKDIITIDNKFDDAFKVLKQLEINKAYDKDGDHYTEFIYKCIDKEYINCLIQVRSYDNKIIMFICNYNNIRYCYQGKVIEF